MPPTIPHASPLGGGHAPDHLRRHVQDPLPRDQSPGTVTMGLLAM
jgi:hypothetical protein